MSPVRMAKAESAIRAALAFNDAFNRHDVAAITRLISDDCVLETAMPAPDGERFEGKAAIAAYWERYVRAAPDARRSIEESFGFGHRCVIRWRCEWTDESGARRRVRGVDIFEEKDGAIREHLSYAKG